MPWFALEPEDRVDDPRVIELSAEAYCLHDLLCCRALRHGPLVERASLYRSLWASKFRSRAAFDAAYSAAILAFDRDSEGRLVLTWIEDARSETDRRLNSDNERKRRGRRSTAQNGLGGSPLKIVRPDIHPESGGTSDVIPSYRQTDTTDRTQQKEKPARKLAVGEAAELTRHLEAEFLRTRKTAYVHGGAKDGTAAAWLVKALGLPEAARRATAMLDDPDAWIAKGASLAFLRSQVNRWAPALRQTQREIQLAQYPDVETRPR